MRRIASWLDTACKTAGYVIAGVSIGDPDDKSTWKVHPTSFQIACQPIIDAFDPNDPALLTAENLQQFTARSRQKDVLASCALSVRTRNMTAWNNMTPAQKKTATLAEADIWVGIRQFIEDNT